MEHFNFLKLILSNLNTHPDRNAFYIKGAYYTYGELAGLIAEIQSALSDLPDRELYTGVYLGDDIQTYASVLALWLSGRAFVPINPLWPGTRNRSIADQLNLKHILHSKEIRDRRLLSRCRTINTGNLDLNSGKTPALARFPRERDLYVLFTSGSTGIPKGVRISAGNLDAFIRDFIGYPVYSFTPEDRFLQIYDLSFDASLPCYVVPLVAGSCIYTVPAEGIKYLAAYKLIQDHRLTFIKMTPSVLSYLRPYFPSIRLEDVKYCLLGGEAFPSRLARKWEKCVPNALIQNVYGPTETTIICSIYDWNRQGSGRKEFNGIVSIGKVYGTNRAVVIREDQHIAEAGETGELLIAGDQLSPGYWNDPGLNEQCFVELECAGKTSRFYRTGDLVMMDSDGDLMYLGRNDDQVQVQGYRVELGEIEKYAMEFTGGKNVVAMGKDKETGEMKLYLFVESEMTDFRPLSGYLKKHLPAYMIPSEIIAVREFPRLVSGKMDRKALIQFIPS